MSDKMKRIPGSRAIKILICLCLIIINGAIFFQTRHYQTVYFEEEEAAVLFQDGITLDNLKIALFYSVDFTQMWLPVSFLACMLSAELFGDDPGPKHLINLFLHTCSTLFLFLCFSSMTGAVRPSALLAALFAAHPVNVESVAWLAHHDSALNLFFITLSLCCYVKYVRTSSKLWYLLVLLMYLLALLSNARIMTFPLLLILLDFWPLSRLRPEWEKRPGKKVPDRLYRLLTSRPVKEKLPLLGIGFFYGLVMTIFKIAGSDTPSTTVNPFDALTSCFAYVGRLFLLPGIEYNRFMAPFHPSLWQIIVSVAGLTAISYGIFRVTSANRCYPAVGWLWFLIALIPGVLVNAGKHVMITDRYAYLGTIGIFIIVAFGLYEVMGGTRWKRVTAAVAGIIMITVLAYAARHQTRNWQSRPALLEHTIAIAPDRVNHRTAGDIFLADNRIDDAIRHYRKALKSAPESAFLHMNIGVAFLNKEEIQKAFNHFEKALSLQPDQAGIHHNMGNAFLESGYPDKAIAHFTKALEIDPVAYRTYNSLATALVEAGRIEEAIACLQEALRINPGYATARHNLRQLTAP